MFADRLIIVTDG